MKKKIVIISIIVGSLGLYAFVDNEFKISKSLDIFFNLYKELNFYYVDDIDPEKIMQSGIDGMLESLDPYTTFIPESDLDDFKFQTTGQYGGIGAIIRKIGDNVIIAEPYENFPASKAGLKAGDILIEIDGKDIKNKGVSDVSEALKGEPGTEVAVVIQRPGIEKSIKKKIERERITVPNVPYYGIVRDSTGYIRLTNFTTDAGKDVREAVTELKKQNVKAIILDLRGNPGGLLLEAVEVANCFIPDNQLIVYTKGKVKEASKRYITIRDPVDTVTPLAVLVSRGSASASEIVAGALQDLDRAVIIGQRTFGKGLVQQTRPLSYNTQLKVTTAKYYIPSGRCIQARDYSHRNEDGSVGYIPDSLIKEFKTRTGRKVYDGGGILPDIKLETSKMSDIAFNLYTKNYIFDFATEYSQRNVTIASARDFKINEYIYNEFVKFLNGKEFDYKTKTEEQLKSLIETAKKEKYYSQSDSLFKLLREKLSHDRNKDLLTFKDEISELLIDEIVVRYYYQKGRIIASFNVDTEIDSTLKVLNDNKRYYSILTGEESKQSKTDISSKNDRYDTENIDN
jgi:carboxyl-terminal processing protease